MNRYIRQESDELEDLRHIMYVATTRAKSHLQISYCLKTDSGKDQKLSILISPLINDQVKVESVESFDLPNSNSSTYSLALSDDLMSLIKARVVDFNISASSTNNWISCQNKFFFNNICKLPDLPSEAMSFGNLIHGALEAISKNLLLQSSPGALLSLVDDVYKKYQNQFHPLHGNRYKFYAEQVIRNYLKNFPITNNEISTEKFLTATLPNGVELNGFIDRLEITENAIFVIDYKTGKQKTKLIEYIDELNPGNRYWRQAAIYYYILKKHYPNKKNIHLSFHYTELNDVVTFDNIENSGFLDWLKIMWDQIHKMEFAIRCDDDNCIYCKESLKLRC